MGASKNQQDKTSSAQGASESASPVNAVVSEITTLRNDCLTQLKAISARVQQLSMQASSDWVRSVNDAHLGMQMRQQSLFMDYLGKAQQAPLRAEAAKELHELSTRCSSDFEVSRSDAHKAVESSRDQLEGAIDAGIRDANREWDATCIGFVNALRERIAGVDPTTMEPASLAAAGQSLAWIATLMRPVANR
ncbi:hypothetical protein [Roseateles sp. P5_D6]